MKSSTSTLFDVNDRVGTRFLSDDLKVRNVNVRIKVYVTHKLIFLKTIAWSSDFDEFWNFVLQ